MITWPLSKWYDAVTHDDELCNDWVVTKLEHMKNFHFSAVLHEFLRVTVKHRNTLSQEPKCLIVERMDYGDTVTVGWKWAQYPKLTGWWIKRLLLGYFSGDLRGGISVLKSSSYTSGWQAVGYSGSDFLCHLDFKSGVPLTEFAKVLVNLSGTSYKAAAEFFFFWFASMVYEILKEEWPCLEFKGDYYNHMGKFAGVHILPSKLVSTTILPYF